MSRIVFTEVVPHDLPPLHGPPCPGVTTHRWTLSVREGDVVLSSGCDECDAVYEPYMVEMAELTGRMSWEHEHPPRQCPSFMLGPCDHAAWLQFTPEDGQ